MSALVPLRRVDARSSTAPRRRRRRTGATSTSAGDPNNPPLTRVELRSGPPHHDLRRLRHPGGRRLHGHGVGVLQRPVGPSVVGELQRRLQRRRRARPTTCSTSRRASSRVHVHERHVRGPDDVRQRRAVPGGVTSGRTHERNACRAPWIEHASTSGSTSGCRSSACKAEITWDVLNLINLFDQPGGVARVRELQRPARRAARRSADRRRPPTTWRICSRTACCRRREEQFTRNDLRSRWQMQLGARIRF